MRKKNIMPTPTDSALLPGQVMPSEPAAANPEPEVLCILLDYDGCFASRSMNPNFQGIIPQHELTQYHAKLIAHINTARINATTVVFGLGTNRQDYDLDQFNAEIHNNGSCTTTLFSMQKYFHDKYPDVIFFADPFMMADIYHPTAIEAGTSFKKIYQNKVKEVHTKTVFDETKISLIYAHAHRIALRNPTTKIIIHFFDDKDTEILKPLGDFFIQHADLLPKNVILRLFHYDHGQGLQPDDQAKCVVQGTGTLDAHYDLTTKLFVFFHHHRKRILTICDWQTFDTFVEALFQKLEVGDPTASTINLEKTLRNPEKKAKFLQVRDHIIPQRRNSTTVMLPGNYFKTAEFIDANPRHLTQHAVSPATRNYFAVEDLTALCDVEVPPLTLDDNHTPRETAPAAYAPPQDELTIVPIHPKEEALPPPTDSAPTAIATSSVTFFSSPSPTERVMPSPNGFCCQQ